MTLPKIKWAKLTEPQGVIVGCTSHQEWLLPWWWMNYCVNNSYPVTFVNFGDMSPQAMEWCRKRGRLISLDFSDDFIARKEKIDPALAKTWKKMNSQVWKVRLAWFKKPLALLQSCYEKAIWIDLDCQVRGSLEPLFETYLIYDDVALVEDCEIDQKINQENGMLLPGELSYNAGVMAFRHGAKLIQEWAKQSLSHNHQFMGDQQLLVRIIYSEYYPIAMPPMEFNWPTARCGANPQAVILHWWGAQKKIIQQHIELLKQHFYIDLAL